MSLPRLEDGSDGDHGGTGDESADAVGAKRLVAHRGDREGRVAAGGAVVERDARVEAWADGGRVAARSEREAVLVWCLVGGVGAVGARDRHRRVVGWRDAARDHCASDVGGWLAADRNIGRCRRAVSRSVSHTIDTDRWALTVGARRRRGQQSRGWRRPA